MTGLWLRSPQLKFGVVFVFMADIMPIMKRGGNAGIRVLAGVLLSASAIVVTSFGAAENPYSAIVERNVFNLHPPPPPLNPADLIKKTPPPKITLTGITTILGKKAAWLTVPPTKPGAAPESVMLTEGQAQNEIEVKSIDERAQVVQVVNHGEPETLDFIKDGAKISGPPPGGPPTPMTLPSPIPAAPPPGVQPGGTFRSLRSLPTRNSSAENNGGGGGVGAGNSIQQQQDNLTPEEQVALIEVQRVKALQEHDPIANLLPPTALTPEVMGQAPQ
jgi:hypothetical protein